MLTTTIWDQVLSRIEVQVGKHSFSTWFKPTSLLADGGSSLRIRVPNLLFVEWLPKHYSVVLAEALRDVGRGDVKLVFVPDAPGGCRGGSRAVDQGVGRTGIRQRRPSPPKVMRRPRRNAPAASSPATPSTRSSSGRRTSLRMRRAARWRKRRRDRTTRCSFTAASDWARRT